MPSSKNPFSWSPKDSASALSTGPVVLLVNEHTASAGEMVSAFAEENNLGTIVGTKMPGRLLSGSAF
jgi:carboxyl-terminal processing protease